MLRFKIHIRGNPWRKGTFRKELVIVERFLICSGVLGNY